MIHPFRTLLYGLFVEPWQAAWQHLLERFEGGATGGELRHSAVVLVGDQMLVPAIIKATTNTRQIL